jgi:hypothetical protein
MTADRSLVVPWLNYVKRSKRRCGIENDVMKKTATTGCTGIILSSDSLQQKLFITNCLKFRLQKSYSEQNRVDGIK